MSAHTSCSEELRELALLAGVGLPLPHGDGDTGLLAAHLAAGCGECGGLAREGSDIAAALAIGCGRSTVSSAAGERTLADVGESALLLDSGNIFALDSARLPWRELGGGISAKVLSSDRVANESTRLLRMAPGSRLPAHRHGRTEHVMVLEGEVEVEGTTLRAGAYCLAQANSVHNVTASARGCILLVTGGLDDEILGHGHPH